MKRAFKLYEDVKTRIDYSLIARSRQKITPEPAIIECWDQTFCNFFKIHFDVRIVSNGQVREARCRISCKRTVHRMKFWEKRFTE